MDFISHARTPEELRDEVVSDIRRRIATLDGYSNLVARNASERARLARTTEELKDILNYWSNLTIVRPKTKRELIREEKQKGISGSVTLPHIPSTTTRTQKDPH